MTRKKLDDIMTTMNRLQLALQEPDTRPINGAKEHRLTVISSQQKEAILNHKSIYRDIDDLAKRSYYAVDPQELAKQRQHKQPGTHQLRSTNTSQASAVTSYRQKKSSKSPKTLRCDFLNRIKERNSPQRASGANRTNHQNSKNLSGSATPLIKVSS